MPASTLPRLKVQSPPAVQGGGAEVGTGEAALVGGGVAVAVGVGDGEGAGNTPHAPATEREPVNAALATQVEGESTMAREGAEASQSLLLNVVKSALVAPYELIGPEVGASV